MFGAEAVVPQCQFTFYRLERLDLESLPCVTVRPGSKFSTITMKLVPSLGLDNSTYGKGTSAFLPKPFFQLEIVGGRVLYDLLGKPICKWSLARKEQRDLL